MAGLHEAISCRMLLSAYAESLSGAGEALPTSSPSVSQSAIAGGALPKGSRSHAESLLALPPSPSPSHASLVRALRLFVLKTVERREGLGFVRRLVVASGGSSRPIRNGESVDKSVSQSVGQSATQSVSQSAGQSCRLDCAPSAGWLAEWRASGDAQLLRFAGNANLPRFNPLTRLPLFRQVHELLCVLMHTGDSASLDGLLSSSNRSGRAALTAADRKSVV